MNLNDQVKLHWRKFSAKQILMRFTIELFQFRGHNERTLLLQ